MDRLFFGGAESPGLKPRRRSTRKAGSTFGPDAIARELSQSQSSSFALPFLCLNSSTQFNMTAYGANGRIFYFYNISRTRIFHFFFDPDMVLRLRIHGNTRLLEVMKMKCFW